LRRKRGKGGYVPCGKALGGAKSVGPARGFFYEKRGKRSIREGGKSDRPRHPTRGKKREEKSSTFGSEGTRSRKQHGPERRLKE